MMARQINSPMVERIYVRFIFLSIIFLAFSDSANAMFSDTLNFFEGTIIYEIKYFAKNGTDVSNFSERYGNKATLHYKAGSYRIDYNGSETKAHVYRADSSLRYMKIVRNGKSDIIRTDLKRPVSYITKIDSIENRITVHTLFTNGASSTMSYTFEPSLSINPEVHRHWHYNHLNTIFEIGKCLWRKQRIETENYSIEWIAVDIKRVAIDSAIFILR